MKIVCDACSAKYSIADEKVRGKVFKIRCKKCSNIIVVRGTTGENDAAQQSFDQKETRVFDYAGYDKGGDAAAEGAVWHVVIDQEQVGPLSAPEVFERYSRGEIDDETYTWREGFADWQPLSQVEAFANIASAAGASAPAPAAAPAPADDVAGMFGGPSIDDSAAPQDDPGDLFAAAGGSSGGSDLFGSGGGGGGVGMAATMPAPSGGSSMADGLFGDEDEPDPAADRQLTGQRNENSVLFSLGNLAALAGDSARSPSAPAPSSSGGGFGGGSSSGMAGADGQEGSGLIDIRAMANAYLGDKSAGPPARRLLPRWTISRVSGRARLTHLPRCSCQPQPPPAATTRFCMP